MAFLSSSPPIASSRMKRWSPDDDDLFDGGNVDVTVHSQSNHGLQPQSSPPGLCKPRIRPLHLQSGSAAGSAQQPLSPSLGMAFQHSMCISSKADQPNIGNTSGSSDSALKQSGALSSKDTNCLSRRIDSVHSKPIARLPIKRPADMLFNRTSSASVMLQPEDSSKVSPHPAIILQSSKTTSGFRAIRPKQLFKRSLSENVATLGNDHGRKPSLPGSMLSNEIVCPVFPQRQHPVPAARGSAADTGESTQRRISGSARLKAAIQALPQSKPQLLHTSSAPIAHPHVFDIFGAMSQRSSEPAVPTQSSLLAYHAQRAMELSSSSPDKMNTDDHYSIPSSSPAKSIASSVAGQLQVAVSPGLGDLFADVNGLDRCQLVDSSPAAPTYRVQPKPAAQVQAGRKRDADEAESSFASSAGPSSPSATLVATHSRISRLSLPSSCLANEESNHPLRDVLGPLSAGTADAYGRASGRRPIYRASSSNSISNKRRNSGQAHSASATCSHTHLLSESLDNARHAPIEGTLSRHPMRPSFGKRNLISRSYTTGECPANVSRRTQSMCDSEFYASPPLSINDLQNTAVQADYFAGSAAATVVPISNRQTFAAPVATQCGNDALRTSASAFETREETGKVLPCFHVQQDRLMRITPTTLNNLLDGDYDSQVDQYVIIDCRFAYEHEGGHIEGAMNINTEAAIEKFLFQVGGTSLFGTREQIPAPSSSARPNPGRTVLVFHCEFSAMRAPKLAGHVRSKDRAMNHEVYPAVHYPEVYILHGGYAAYYKEFALRCDGGYVVMDDPQYLAARASELGQIRRNKLGARSHSYADGMFGKRDRESDLMSGIQKLSNAAMRPTSSSFLTQRCSSNLTSSGVSSSACLDVHHEEHEGLDSGTGECGSPGAGSYSKSHQNFAMIRGGNGQSSPSGMDTSGEVASPSAPKKRPTRPPFLKSMLVQHRGHADTFPLRPASRDRVLQRATTASVLPLFG